MQDTFTTVKT